MQVTVAIPTFDRQDMLAVTAGLVNRAPWLNRANLRVFDDASSLRLEDLRGFYPTACQLEKRPENLGADGNLRQIFADFLNTSDECLFVLDCDLVVSEKALDVLLEALPQTDGVLSLYNSCCHPSYSKFRHGTRTYDLKQTVGAAGMVLTRERVEEVLAHVPPGRSFDWRCSHYLTEAGYRLFVTSQSYVQHIGFDGQNCNNRVIDFGLSFDCDDQTTRVMISHVLETELLKKIARLRQFDQELGVHLRCIGRILERKVRCPLKMLKKLKIWLQTLLVGQRVGPESDGANSTVRSG